MEYDEELLLEEYIKYEKMSQDERDICVQLLRNIKEITDSEVKLNSKSNTNFEIITINFAKEGRTIKFNGALSNDEEQRWIDGVISRKGNKYYVASNIYRLFEYVDEDEKDYTTLDTFIVNEENVIRRTNYTNSDNYYEAELASFDGLELYEYYSKKIGKHVMKRDLK